MVVLWPLGGTAQAQPRAGVASGGAVADVVETLSPPDRIDIARLALENRVALDFARRHYAEQDRLWREGKKGEVKIERVDGGTNADVLVDEAGDRLLRELLLAPADTKHRASYLETLAKLSLHYRYHGRRSASRAEDILDAAHEDRRNIEALPRAARYDAYKLWRWLRGKESMDDEYGGMALHSIERAVKLWWAQRFKAEELRRQALKDVAKKGEKVTGLCAANAVMHGRLTNLAVACEQAFSPPEEPMEGLWRGHPWAVAFARSLDQINRPRDQWQTPAAQAHDPQGRLLFDSKGTVPRTYVMRPLDDQRVALTIVEVGEAGRVAGPTMLVDVSRASAARSGDEERLAGRLLVKGGYAGDEERDLVLHLQDGSRAFSINLVDGTTKRRPTRPNELRTVVQRASTLVDYHFREQILRIAHRASWNEVPSSSWEELPPLSREQLEELGIYFGNDRTVSSETLKKRRKKAHERRLKGEAAIETRYARRIPSWRKRTVAVMSAIARASSSVRKKLTPSKPYVYVPPPVIDRSWPSWRSPRSITPGSRQHTRLRGPPRAKRRGDPSRRWWKLLAGAR